MKRGRPNVRGMMSKHILALLESSKLPMSTSAITQDMEQKIGKKVSWNTVQKYMDELITLGKIEPIDLPHSKDENKKGLTVYALKND